MDLNSLYFMCNKNTNYTDLILFIKNNTNEIKNYLYPKNGLLNLVIYIFHIDKVERDEFEVLLLE